MAPGASVLTPPAGTGESEIPQAPGAGTGATPEASGSPATSPTPTVTPSTNLVGGGSDAYNPNAAQPYSAPVATPVTPMVPAANALGPEPEANGAVNHAGAIAYAVSKGLHGYMKGLAVRQINQGIQLQKQSVGLQQNLDTASQQLYALAKAGTDQNSPQYQAALNQVTAAHQAQLDFMKQHVAGEQIDKKTGQLKPQEGSIASRLFQTQDPAAIPLAAYQAAEKLGPPVLHQIAPFQTPQYQAYAKTQAQTAQAQAQVGLTQTQTASTQAQLAGTQAQQDQRWNQLATKTTPRTPEEEQEYQALGSALNKPGTGIQRAIDERSADIAYRVRAGLMSPEEGDKELVQLKSTRGLVQAKPPTIGSTGWLMQQALTALGHKEDGSDIPADQRAQVLGRVNQWAKAQGQNATVSSGPHWVKIDDGTGHLVDVNVGQSSSRTPTAVSLPPSVLPAHTPQIGQDAASTVHNQALSSGDTPAQATAKARAVGTAINNSYFGNYKILQAVPTNLPARRTKDEQTADDNALAANTALEKYQRAYADTTRNHSADDAGLKLDWIRSHVNRVSQKEIDVINSVGGAEAKLDRLGTPIWKGEMSPMQRSIMMNTLRDNATTWTHQKGLYDQARAVRGGLAIGSGTGGGPATTTPGSQPPPPPSNDVSKFFVRAQ